MTNREQHALQMIPDREIWMDLVQNSLPLQVSTLTDDRFLDGNVFMLAAELITTLQDWLTCAGSYFK